jgi:TonB-dependent SusC/RagA subfamily outer membrane receptor
MDNHDKLYNQIKSAAKNAESKDFPSMDKVWSRVEEKLDKKVLTKQNTLWKKIAVAASLLLFVSIAYQFLKEDEKIEIPQNSTTVIDTDKTVVNDSITSEKVVSTEKLNPNIKENADEILQKQIIKPASVAVNDTVTNEIYGLIETDNGLNQNAPVADRGFLNSASSNSSSDWLAGRKFESRGVTYKKAEKEITTLKTAPKAIQSEKKKSDPLVVMDDMKSDKQELSSLSEEEVESIVELNNPLYIINGVYYTELELYGPNPTSPYAPLDKQKIETISILQDEKAISIYGEKGKDGVVIITTKDGKPATKKR